MAQVTMDSKEYIELLDKSRGWDSLAENLIQETTVDFSEEHHMGYSIKIAFGMPKKAKMGIAQKIVEQVIKQDDVMRNLVKADETMLDVQAGYFARNWGDNRTNQVDMMKFPEFKTKYEAIKAELAEEE